MKQILQFLLDSQKFRSFRAPTLSTAYALDPTECHMAGKEMEMTEALQLSPLYTDNITIKHCHQYKCTNSQVLQHYIIANNLIIKITLQLHVFKLTKILKITNSG